MIKKIKSKKGETLTELILAILIGTASLMALFSFLGAAADINSRANAKDEDSYKILTELAEGTAEKTEGSILVGGQTVNVDYFTTDDGIRYYKNKDSDGVTP